MLDDEGDLLDDLVLGVDLDDPLVAGLGDHGQSVRQALKRMNLDGAFVRFLGLRDMLPDHLLVGRHLDDGHVVGWDEDVTVG